MWKPLPSRRILETLRGSLKRTISVSGGIGLLQMYQSQTLRCASKEAELRRGWTRGGVLARTLGLKGVDCGVPHQLEKGTSVREDVGHEGGVDCKILHRLGRRMKRSL